VLNLNQIATITESRNGTAFITLTQPKYHPLTECDGSKHLYVETNTNHQEVKEAIKALGGVQ
jgi:hypothetical protein